MGCVVSSEGDDDRRRIIGVSAHHHHHHIVSLTSSTYGILTAPRAYSSSSSAGDIQFESSDSSVDVDVDVAVTTPPPPPPPPPQPTPEVINSWELMAGLLDPSSTPATAKTRRRRLPLRPIDGNAPNPPKFGIGGAVLYTTSLRALRATFEACNAVRAVLQAHGVAFRERDVSMDRGFRDDLLRLLSSVSPVDVDVDMADADVTVKAKAPTALLLPRLFVRGRHVGGADEVLRLDEEGKLAPLLDGLPKTRGGIYSCDGCGGMRFLPCFDCSGSRKLVMRCRDKDSRSSSLLVVRCRDCNENGLVLCPICS